VFLELRTENNENSNCPFWIDLFHQSTGNNENSNGELFLSTISDLPAVPSMKQEIKERWESLEGIE
jgi:hypothetical protein